MVQRGESRTAKSTDVLMQMRKSLPVGQDRLTNEQSVKFGKALSDIAIRLEQATDTLIQLLQLSRPETALKDVRLTQREGEILAYIAEGKTNGEIAARCWISENTVKFHLKNLFRKLEIRDRGQAMMIAKGVRQTINSNR